MGEFLDSFNGLKHSSFFTKEMDSNLENLCQLPDQPNLDYFLMENSSFEGLSSDGSCSSHQLEFLMPSFENLSSLVPVECLKQSPLLSRPMVSTRLQSHGNKKIKDSGIRKRERSIRRVEKPKEVVHVRAKRGQATDSHSLAERVRREKINEKMRCLKDLVPGCYKAMSTTGMLDVIIDYVQSLQNQVKFLSMRLEEASSFCDNSLDLMEAVATPVPQVDNVHLEEEGLVGDVHGGLMSFLSAMPF